MNEQTKKILEEVRKELKERIEDTQGAIAFLNTQLNKLKNNEFRRPDSNLYANVGFFFYTLTELIKEKRKAELRENQEKQKSLMKKINEMIEKGEMFIDLFEKYDFVRDKKFLIDKIKENDIDSLLKEQEQVLNTLKNAAEAAQGDTAEEKAVDFVKKLADEIDNNRQLRYFAADFIKSQFNLDFSVNDVLNVKSLVNFNVKTLDDVNNFFKKDAQKIEHEAER